MSLESHPHKKFRWTQWIAPPPEEVAVAPTSSEDESPRELPPEMIEHILQYLTKDRKTTLCCRLINNNWKSATDNFLERQTRQNWTTWIPTLTPPTFPLFPVLPLVYAGQLFRLLFVEVPLGLTKHKVNPFPTRSLTLTNENSRPENCMDKYNYSSVKYDKLLQNFGCHLTTFVLHGASITICQLDGMLKKLVNLKALTLSLIIHKKSWKDKSISSKKSEAELTHFVPQLKSFRAVELCEPQIIQWVVVQIGHRLLNLEVDAWKLKPLQQQQQAILDVAGSKNSDDSPPPPPTTSPPHMQLQNLKIVCPSNSFLELTGKFELQNLSILDIQRGHNIAPNFLFKFLDKFSTTLVYLHLDVDLFDLELKELDEMVNLTARKPIPIGATFPNVVKLDVRIPKVTGLEAGLFFLKRLLLPKFPALEHLRLLPMNRMTPLEIANLPREWVYYVGKEKFNTVCRNLKRVSLQEDFIIL
ncbi:unnamed protein product [Orchesella dallaii]|uniref:F-box domain-containing protein n=1 Tax=Orchesella dallaii TaxID=48710 RepID=A0ABP1RIX2_9HEXA